MIENYPAAKFWFDIVQTVFLIGYGAYLAWTEKNRVTHKRITELDKKYQSKFDGFAKEHEEKCGNHHQRTAKIEVELSKAPTHKDLGEIHEKINAVHGSMKEMAGHMKGLNASVGLIHEYLLNREKNK